MYKKNRYHSTLHWAWRGPALQGPDVQPRARRTARNQQPWGMLSEDALAGAMSSRSRVVWGRVWTTTSTWASCAFLKTSSIELTSEHEREREALFRNRINRGSSRRAFMLGRYQSAGAGLACSVSAWWWCFDGWSRKRELTKPSSFEKYQWSNERTLRSLRWKTQGAERRMGELLRWVVLQGCQGYSSLHQGSPERASVFVLSPLPESREVHNDTAGA